MARTSRDWFLNAGYFAGRPSLDFCPHGNGIWYDTRPTYSWDGEPPHYRTKSSHPYSYDAFFIHGDHESIKDASADYTDRYPTWNVEKYRCALKAIGRDTRWDQMSLHEVDRFVKAYYGDDFEAAGLVEWCNASNGYPCWSIHFRRLDSEDG